MNVADTKKLISVKESTKLTIAEVNPLTNAKRVSCLFLYQ